MFGDRKAVKKKTMVHKCNLNLTFNQVQGQVIGEKIANLFLSQLSDYIMNQHIQLSKSYLIFTVQYFGQIQTDYA